MKPWELDELQPYEFYDLLDGYYWRMERQESLAAYFVCQLLNVSGRTLKKAVGVKDLLKPLRQPARDKKKDKQYLKEVFKNSLDGGE